MVLKVKNTAWCSPPHRPALWDRAISNGLLTAPEYLLFAEITPISQEHGVILNNASLNGPVVATANILL